MTKKVDLSQMRWALTRFQIFILFLKKLQFIFLETEKENLAIFRSKAVGEPPLMYGIGAYFALHNAIKAFNPAAEIAFDAPMTPEKVLMNLHANIADLATKGASSQLVGNINNPVK